MPAPQKKSPTGKKGPNSSGMAANAGVQGTPTIKTFSDPRSLPAVRHYDSKLINQACPLAVYSATADCTEQQEPRQLEFPVCRKILAKHQLLDKLRKI
ncbi:hypothetical protein Y032_0133g1783 [Ancylostoma ceylanicum]|uniref:Uncharacterized protein n=1 Tax=Ancylostoma ceylanicum TaxID=53326 RepID=A0A016T6J5_9BILA|nr:hypothetical protein Y032_0133g1783 [Ancylostoma ceylanicum]